MVVTDILAFVERQLESELRIQAIVDFSGYGRRYLQILFKKHTNIPLGQYIRERRLTRAAILLQLTKMPLIDIAMKFQFDSQQSFSREFKKLTGCTPLQYRKGKLWDFRHLLPSVIINEPIPEPLEVIYIMGRDIYGFRISHEEELLSRGSKYRTGYILRQLSREKGGDVWCFTQTTNAKTRFDTMMLETAIGIRQKDKDGLLTRYSSPNGWYAHFRFRGGIQEYAIFTTNIYLRLLPYHQLTRTAGADLEIFTLDKDMLVCDYYVPVLTDVTLEA